MGSVEGAFETAEANLAASLPNAKPMLATRRRAGAEAMLIGHRYSPDDREWRCPDRVASRDGDGVVAILPPIAIVLGIQRWFVAGLIEPEK